MRIAIHAGTLRGAGSAMVGRGVLSAMAAAPGHHQLTAWVPREWGWVDGGVGAGVKLNHTQPGLVNKLRFENIVLRRALLSGRCDRLFSMGDTSTPHPRIPHLLFVQQAFLAYPPEHWGFVPPARMAARMKLMSAYFRAGIGGVSLFTVQTEDMKAHLAERWGIRRSHIAVVPSSIDLPTPHVPETENPRSDRKLVYVANGGPHKNHVVLVDMMAELDTSMPDVRCQLTVARGTLPAFERHARARGVLGRFEFLGSQSRASVAQLLRDAMVAVIPSKLESFGMAYYEAMAVGCPVVAAARGFAREACGDAARYADPDRGEDFAEQVAILLGSEERRREATRRGSERIESKRITWSEIAARYLTLLEGM